MLKRYALPPMWELWSDEKKFWHWLKMELAVLKARVKLGEIPPAVYEAVEMHATINVARIEELEAEFGHDMISFVVSVQESLEAAGFGQYKEEVHKGITSYDVEDPALVLMLREAVYLILNELENLQSILRIKAADHKWTMMIIRTHGQYAEPSTFGHLLKVYEKALERSYQRLRKVLYKELNEGKISGAVGAYGGINPQLEAIALESVGLAPAKAETQILQRDRHAAIFAALAIIAGTIEQMCRTFWEMMRSDVRELEEPRGKRQRGSSAMPQKKNPILTERFMGLPRVIRGFALAALENIATPEGRDISQSCVERIILPDATAYVHYMLAKMTGLVQNLVVFPAQMMKHLEEDSLGVWAAQRVRIALMNAGVLYDTAYEYTQRVAFGAVDKQCHFLEELRVQRISENDPRTARDVLGAKALEACFDPKSYIEQGIEHIFSN